MSKSSTNTASTPELTVFQWAKNGIEFVKRMTVFAVCCLSKFLHPPPVRVLRSGHQSEMVRIDALRIPAPMVNREIVRNIPNKKLVGGSMGKEFPFYVRRQPLLDLPVSALVQHAKPFPAFSPKIQLDHLSKPVQQRPEWLTRNLRIFRQSFGFSFRQPFLLPANGFGIGGRLNQVRSCGVWRILGSLIPLAVVLVRDCLKVIRVHAGTVAASVMDFISIWNISPKDVVRDLMGIPAGNLSKAVMLKLPVAFASLRSCPFPTSAFSVQFKLLYETIKDWLVGGHNSIVSPGFLRVSNGLKILGDNLELDKQVERALGVEFFQVDFSRRVFVAQNAYRKAIHGNKFVSNAGPVARWGSWFFNHNKKPTPTSEVNPAVNRGNACQGGQDMFSRFWRLIQSRASMVPIPS